jgi:SAM-dependent methyltransferase
MVMPIGFPREKLKDRYDVGAFKEDAWHAYSGTKTARLLKEHIVSPKGNSSRLLNAGAGVYELTFDGWQDVSVDIFEEPIRNHKNPVCASIEHLPFQENTFGAVICVGEVLGYCDPAAVFQEFQRVTEPGGLLICDFGNNRRIRNWFTREYGRAAAISADDYNGTLEQVWTYDPVYIKQLLIRNGFSIKKTWGTHTWSALARRSGLTTSTALALQAHLEWVNLPVNAADVITVYATLDAGAKLRI